METLARLRIRANRTLRIAGAWAAVGAMSALFEHNTLEEAGIAEDLMQRVSDRMLLTFGVGILGGGVYIFLLRDRLRHLAYVPALG
ncbi:MAG TPA: hypothetical protein PKY96_05615, partial [Flavobacteriales bacterium]|nr:hypothetical protein [Flavobacteriales bacterium]